jgi:hypothetical protein
MRRAELISLTSSLGILAVSLTAFSWEVRQQIRERDNYRCQDTGEPARECAHYSHDKSLETYDTPENGRVLTQKSHYMDHFNRHGRPELGLSNHHNLWALKTIWKRLSDEEKVGLPTPEEVLLPRQMKMFR